MIALGLYVYLLVMLRRAEEVRVGTTALVRLLRRRLIRVSWRLALRGVAQLVERDNRTVEARGSIPPHLHPVAAA